MTATIHVLVRKPTHDDSADMRDESDWITTFFDGTDKETGERFGIVERRRLVSSVPCIGCTIHRTNPDNAVSKTYEVWANGEYEGFETVGCYCDLQATAGCTPWRDTGMGTLDTSRVCQRCKGRGYHDSKAVRGATIDCRDCVDGLIPVS